ncbi:DNase I-like protein [Tothia fuscella]|uniref:DNase I-like protein n=1 Tax=Tothia fuscella TaxID=1048955 RepID=A0A9P4NME4_9PEZI|nr:DNase I-like protein [Tothia fuscella]
MANMDSQDDTDDSSIKPVSSLKSHFENMIKSKSSQNSPSPSLTPSRGMQGPGHVESFSRGASLDIPRSSPVQTTPPNLVSNHSEAGKGDDHPSRAGTPRLRPVSMGPMSPPTSPPRVTINSPRSPPKFPSPPSSRGVSARPSREEFSKPLSSRGTSPTAATSRFKIPSRTTTPAFDTRQAPNFPPVAISNITTDPHKPPSPSHGAFSATSTIPPPINRAGKPKTFGKPTATPSRQVSESLEPRARNSREEERISPFSTPPSEHESLHDDASPSPPPIPASSKPRAPPRPPRDNYFAPRGPPIQHADRGSAPLTPVSESKKGDWVHSMKLQGLRLSSQDREVPEDRPSLPPRRADQPAQPRNRSPRPPPPPPPSEPPTRRSMDTWSSTASTARPSMEGPPRASMDSMASNRNLVADTNARFQPPPRRVQTFGMGHSQSSRTSNDVKRPEISSRGRRFAESGEDTDEDEMESMSASPAAGASGGPDSSHANRRLPIFKDQNIQEIPTGYDTKLFAVCGEWICTSGFITRVWNLTTGKLKINIPHDETKKVTALGFKPFTDVIKGATRIWLGTHLGEIHEIDITNGEEIAIKSSAHLRVPITKIHRQKSEMWTLDTEGKLNIWPAGDDGLPSLELSPHVCYVPKGATFSIIVGEQLWMAYGKEIHIFQHNAANRTAIPILSKPLMQSGVGEITAASIISSESDRIYFGHIDGKVTIYSRKDYSCLEVINASLYKIGILVGVGDYLWAGYNTGNIRVYDTRVSPWVVKKDWKAHKDTIAGIIVDRSSIWNLDRLQVASLGTDNLLKLWDGMLEDDWLETDMEEHQPEFCSFREVSALVMSWNAGASKPNYLRQDERDNNFFRELLRSSGDPPDIVVFGFQELVDLEDKKVTAKTLFKSSKKKDHMDQERMSHQYRTWRDFLVKCLDEYMPSNQRYTLLHTANLVGLFTCIFVKSSQMASIRDVDAAEVKLGMKGRYGNKGALLVRFLLDDSSICFVNCHLAAGQKNTAHRNNDIAAILQEKALKSHADADTTTDFYVGGGDGSLILDHEICILNGDLNYRIDSMTRDIVIREVNAGNLPKLLERDQLTLSKKRNPAMRLRAFREMDITFAPTYKYDVGSDQYDSSEKKRSPAWCDRLLYRGWPRVKQLEYRRHEVRVSDHRPVSGIFRIKVKTIDERKKSQVKEQSRQRFEEVKERIATDIKADLISQAEGLSKSGSDGLE